MILILLDLVPERSLEFASGPNIIPSEWTQEFLRAETKWEELGPEEAGSTPLAHSWVPESRRVWAPPPRIQHRASVRRRLPPPPTIRWIKIALHRP